MMVLLGQKWPIERNIKQMPPDLAGRSPLPLAWSQQKCPRHSPAAVSIRLILRISSQILPRLLQVQAPAHVSGVESKVLLIGFPLSLSIRCRSAFGRFL
jgi:hypothetical protein